MRSSPAILIVVLGAGCPTAQLDGGGGRSDGEMTRARATFEANVLPMLGARCESCHLDPAHPEGAPAFLLPNPEVYDTVMVWPGLVVPGAPDTSAILVAQQHDGPSWTAQERDMVLRWIALEGTASATPQAELETAPIVIETGNHIVDLEVLGMPGTITFSTQWLELAGSHFSDLEAHAGELGLRLVRPRLVPWLDGQRLEEIVIADGEIVVAPRGTASLCRDQLFDLPDGVQIGFRFDVVEAVREEGVVESCRDPDAFEQIALPVLRDGCGSCHGGLDARATGLFDLGAAPDAACDLAMLYVDPAEPLQSALIVQVDPEGGTLHPFAFSEAAAFEAYRSAILEWIER